MNPFFTKVEPLNKEVHHTHIVMLNKYGNELLNLLITANENGNAISAKAFSVVSEIQNVDLFLRYRYQSK